MLMNIFETLYENTNHELFVLANSQKKLFVMFNIFEVSMIISLITRLVSDKKINSIQICILLVDDNKFYILRKEYHIKCQFFQYIIMMSISNGSFISQPYAIFASRALAKLLLSY